jgi:CHAT domain-containing protein/Tfp pilus assembly protein PilF
MKCFLVSCLLFFSFTASSQDLTELYNQSKDFYLKGEYEKGVAVAEKLVELAKRGLGETSSDYGTCINMLGLLYVKTGQYEKAEPLFFQAKEIKQKTGGENDPDYSTILENLVWVYTKTGQYKKAEPLCIQQIAIKKRLLGEEHAAYATALNDLGILYIYMGRYQEAEPLCVQSTAIRKKVLGENDPDYATSLDNIGALYAAMGQYEKAETLYKQAMAIRKKVLGELHDDYTTSLNNLASLYLSTGEYAKSEPLYIQATALRKKALGENNPDYALSLNNLGALYLAIGQYEKAETLFSQAMNIRKKVWGENHPSYLVSTNNLSQVYAATGQYQKAIQLCIQTIAIRKKVLGQDHPEYATSLNNLAVLYEETGEYTKAEPYCIEAAAIRKKIFGETSSDYAASLNNLAIIYKEMGQYKKAEPLMLQAKDIYKKAEGEQSPQYSISLDNLSILYLTTGEYAKAEPLSILSTNNSLKTILSTFAVLSEKEKGNYLTSKSSITEVNNSLLYNYKAASPSLRKNNFNLQLVLKSLSLADTRNMIATVRNSKDTAVKRLFADWMAAKNFLAKQYALPPDKQEPGLKSMEARTEEMEKELSRKSTNFRNQQSSANISMAEVQKSLQEDEAAIEFVSFNLYTKRWTDSVIYAAYIVRKSDTAPQFVTLCEEKQLKQLFDSAGKSATTMVNNFYRGLIVKNENAKALGDSLYKLIWQPLELYLKGINKISYSPSGKLFSVAFQALPTGEGKLLMDKYQLQQYTSTRQIALRTATNQTTTPQSITLFGDASFTMDSITLAKQRKAQSNPDVSGTIYTPQKRGNNNSSSWNSLPGTAEEVKKIKQLFDQNKISTKSFTQVMASEENLKALNGNSPQVLHIATHGFFLPEPGKKKKELNDNTYTLADDPLLRSGLVLSGGNYAWSGKAPLNGVEDGIATAYEISQLNLSNTELVVLSACETALGDVKGSEGVFGLQRAFKMAGVKKMIVSLWQVPDKETAELMTTFYSYWLGGKNIEESFYQAQSEMRKKYSPFYWAAFVLVG